MSAHLGSNFSSVNDVQQSPSVLCSYCHLSIVHTVLWHQRDVGQDVSLFLVMQGPEGDASQSSGLDAEENMGISSPLYQIIDVVFDLRARGFLRRQV